MRAERHRRRMTAWIVTAFFLVPCGLAELAQAAAAQDKPSWLNQTEWNFIKSQKTIFVAPDPSFPPIEEIDAQGNYRGIAADYLHLIETKLGIQFSVFKLDSWDAVLEAARLRRVDLLPAAANTPKRQEFLLFSSPHVV
jgi:ABC-type amino acid transport substrate-binding protein